MLTNPLTNKVNIEQALSIGGDPVCQSFTFSTIDCLGHLYSGRFLALFISRETARKKYKFSRENNEIARLFKGKFKGFSL